MGTLSLIALPNISGYYSKEYILSNSYLLWSSLFLYYLSVFTIYFTIYYSSKFIYLNFTLFNNIFISYNHHLLLILYFGIIIASYFHLDYFYDSILILYNSLYLLNYEIYCWNLLINDSITLIYTILFQSTTIFKPSYYKFYIDYNLIITTVLYFHSNYWSIITFIKMIEKTGYLGNKFIKLLYNFIYIMFRYFPKLRL